MRGIEANALRQQLDRIKDRAIAQMKAAPAIVPGPSLGYAAPVGSYPATESGLRDGLEKAYRALARDASLVEDRVALVNQANAVRSWTLT